MNRPPIIVIKGEQLYPSEQADGDCTSCYFFGGYDDGRATWCRMPDQHQDACVTQDDRSYVYVDKLTYLKRTMRGGS